MRFSQLFSQNVAVLMKLTQIQVFLFFKLRLCSFFGYIAYSDIYATKYSGGHETFGK